MKRTLQLPTCWLALLLGLWGLSACQKEEPAAAPVTDDAYVFPVVPGTPAWAAFTSGAEMVQACQVPGPVLSSISTPGLITTCLNYPLLGDMLAYIPIQKGARAQLRNFNGFGELQQRPEAAALLAARYQSLCTTCANPAGGWGNYSLAYSYFEMILAQDEFIAQLSSAQRHALVRTTLTKYAEKQREIANYATFGLKTTAFLLARIMQADHYAPFETAIKADANLKTFTTEAEIYGQTRVLDTVVATATAFQ